MPPKHHKQVTTVFLEIKRKRNLRLENNQRTRKIAHLASWQTEGSPTKAPRGFNFDEELSNMSAVLPHYPCVCVDSESRRRA
jgi:hypothetical protein